MPSAPAAEKSSRTASRFYDSRMATRTCASGEFCLSSDPGLLDLDVIHGFLAACYWSPGINRDRLQRAINHSLVYGVYDQSGPLPRQVGFARVISDHATFAYLCDVFILESHRGRGLSAQLMEFIIADPALHGLRRFCLFTRDAHGLYAKYGFQPHPDPTRYMERLDSQSYTTP